jgi:hypothetical protein
MERDRCRDMNCRSGVLPNPAYTIDTAPGWS